jgi:ribosome-binding ATPase YchF (GTP1/OBG family)
VVRCFEDENVPHPNGSVDALRDLAAMDSEFILNDLIAVERRLEKLAEEKKKGAGRDKAVIDREIELFNRFHEQLSQDKLLRDLPLTAEEEKMLAGFGF